MQIPGTGDTGHYVTFDQLSAGNVFLFSGSVCFLAESGVVNLADGSAVTVQDSDGVQFFQQATVHLR